MKLESKGNDAELTLTQEKFCADGSIPENSPVWLIPIAISTVKSPGVEETSFVLSKKSTTITIKDLPSNGWVKINFGTVGFYRTQYSSDMLHRLTPAISNQTLPPLDRLGLLDDLLANVQAGRTPTSEILQLLLAFKNETHYTVWSSISNCLAKLSMLISNTEYYPQFTKYARDLLRGIGQRLGWKAKPNESHSDTLLRTLVLSQLIWYEEADTLKHGVGLYEKRSDVPIPSDLRGVCYRAALRSGGEDSLDAVLGVYRTTNLQEEKDRIGSALGSLKRKNGIWDLTSNSNEL